MSKEDKQENQELVDETYVVTTNQNLSLVEDGLTKEQKTFLLGKTPKNHVYTRKGKGGQEWDYVTGIYVTKVLNFVFNWNWDFEIVEEWEHPKMNDTPTSVITKGRLTVRTFSNGQTYELTKTQFGRADVKYEKNSDKLVDIGNDFKAAATDALKKCASMLGIASDIYGKSEFKDIEWRIETPEVDQKKLDAIESATDRKELKQAMDKLEPYEKVSAMETIQKKMEEL